MGARLISESVFIGASPLDLRRLYTAIFKGSPLRQDARSLRGPEFFRGHLASRVWASTLASGSAFRLDQGRLADAPGKSVKHNRRPSPQLSPIRYTSRRNWPHVPRKRRRERLAVRLRPPSPLSLTPPPLDSLRPATHHRRPPGGEP